MLRRAVARLGTAASGLAGSGLAAQSDGSTARKARSDGLAARKDGQATKTPDDTPDDAYSRAYPRLGYGSDVYLTDPQTSDLQPLVRAWESGGDVWPWVWTWRNPCGPHHVFVGTNARVDAAINELAKDVRNNIVVVVGSPEDISDEAYYYERRCAIVHSTVKLFDAGAKILMLADERIICFDECTLVQPPAPGSPGDAPQGSRGDGPAAGGDAPGGQGDHADMDRSSKT